MVDMSSASSLSFFKADRHKFTREYIFDTTGAPRPHFCIAFITSGEVSVQDCTCGKSLKISSGEIIFVPMGSTYVAKWTGEPNIEYLSLHFVFDMPSIFSRRHFFKLSRIKPTDTDSVRECFEYIVNNYTIDPERTLASLGRLYTILSKALPDIEKSEEKIDRRISSALEYIERNYREGISVDDIARAANMSTSRFYPHFKCEMGQTPIDYLNHVRVGRAIVLMYDRSLSIEEVSAECGFNSSIYFRRVFKKLTGKTPNEYRNNQ